MEENISKNNVRGIKIRTINLCMILISFILYILLILATVSASYRYKQMTSAMEDYIACEKNADMIEEGSDYLTEQVRLYTVTMDKKYVDEYFKEVYTVKRRDSALEEMKALHLGEKGTEYLQSALDNSNELMEEEIYAMKLISLAQESDMSLFPDVVRNMEIKEEDRKLSYDEMIKKARDIVFNQDYQNKKSMIMDDIMVFLNKNIDDTIEKQEDSVQNLKQTMIRQQILISILFVENILMFFLITILIIKPLKIYIENIEDKERLDISGSYEFKYLALTYNNIYELNAANEAMLNYRAEHDPLTGIINRGGFENLRQRLNLKKIPIAFLIIDVDKFKLINDGYGHEVGDLVLKKVAKILENSFRTSDYTARIGGDEFAVILTEVFSNMERVIMKKISDINEELLHPADGLPKVSLSVGGAFSPSGFSDDLYKNADSALYRTKENGRCGCSFYKGD